MKSIQLVVSQDCLYDGCIETFILDRVVQHGRIVYYYRLPRCDEADSS